ncbi:MAG: YbjN domain-containing protein (plasmid) [Leptolyngbya sp. BL-A-14]
MEIEPMLPHTNNRSLQQVLILYDSQQTTLQIAQSQYTVIKDGDRLTELRFILEVDGRLYQRIEQQQLFHLTPEVKGQLHGGKWRSKQAVTLEISLHPDLFAQLADQGEAEIDQFMQQHSDQPDHPLLQTESWYLLSASQQHAHTQASYRTLWSYVELQNLQDPDRNFFQGVNQFVKESAAMQELLASGEVLDEQLLEHIGEWAQSLLQTSTPDTLLDNFTADMIQLFQAATQADSAGEANPTQTAEAPADSLQAKVETFLVADQWQLQPNEGAKALRVSFTGEFGEWNCYALPREDEREFVFYSLAPFLVPEAQRQRVAEFICRANFGLVIGNFELDFDDGGVRFKTSIDVTESELDTPLIRNLVYSNVSTFDRYLPGLLAVTAGTASPAAIINELESE